MPCHTFPIDPIGPVVEIGIAQPRSLVGNTGPAPQIHWVKAVADTGCTHTSLSTGAATKVGLTVISKTPVASTTQLVAVNVYLADVFLRWSIGTQSFEFPLYDRAVLQLLHSGSNYDALLGMDILGLGSFHVNGQTKTATFCW